MTSVQVAELSHFIHERVYDTLRGSPIFQPQQIVTGEWWLFLFPGLAVMITVLSFNLIGDGLRDLLDPRMRGIR